MPAALPAFLERALAKAVTNPTVDNLKSIYNVLCGTGCAELWSLSQALVLDLQSQLKQVLCCNLEVRDHHKRMICLALLSKVASVEVSATPDRKDLSSTDAICTDQETKGNSLSAARKFFGPEKALKTLEATTTIARYAISQSLSQTCPAALGTAIEMLNLCAETAKSVSDAEKRAWLTNRRTMSRAVLEKVLRGDLEPNAQLAVRQRMIAL